MVQVEGKYNHVRSENLDGYFKALGVPYIPRKMMCSSNPTIEILKPADDTWTITTTTLLRKVSYTFNLGEDFEETMPGGVLKCKASLEGENLVIVCIAADGTEMIRTYSFSDDELTITYLHKASQKQAVRHYKRDS